MKLILKVEEKLNKMGGWNHDGRIDFWLTNNNFFILPVLLMRYIQYKETYWRYGRLKKYES